MERRAVVMGRVIAVGTVSLFVLAIFIEISPMSANGGTPQSKTTPSTLAQTLQNQLTVTFINNDQFIIDDGIGTVIYTDVIQQPGASAPPPKIILITHDHGDHFDSSIVTSIATSSGATVVGPSVVINALTGGVPSGQLVSMDPPLYGRVIQTVQGIEIRAYCGNDLNSYRLLLGNGKVVLYHSGDNVDTDFQQYITNGYNELYNMNITMLADFGFNLATFNSGYQPDVIIRMHILPCDHCEVYENYPNYITLLYGQSWQYQYTSPKTTKNIMVTGYWNPTGQMIAQFSTDLYLNPDGWKGQNWEGRGYDIYSYFPCPGTYNGTFVVDYQNTSNDFWAITGQLHPVAIISFGAGNGPWEIEYNARNLDSWVSDNDPPYQPTPCPPDSSKPANYVRHATLPVQAIADAVNAGTPINAWVDWTGNPGAYLCEFMAYHGMWYQDIHNSSSDPYQCLASGFIHVSSGVSLINAIEAANITVRETIKYLDSLQGYSFSLPLKQGWNLISSPISPNSKSPEKFLEGIAGKYDTIMAYDTSTPDQWMMYSISKPAYMNDLKTINETIGLWLRATQDCILVINGTHLTSTSIQLLQGWNLVGYPTLNNTVTVAEAFASAPSGFRVQNYSATEPYNLRDMSSSDIMHPGQGYWVYVPSDWIWVVDW